MARFIGGGYVAYLLVVAAEIGPDSAIVAPWWTPTAVIAAFGPGVGLLVFSFTRARIATTMVLPLACGIGYLVALFTWFAAWTGAHSGGERAIWLVTFPGLAALALVLTRWPWLAMAHLVCAVPVVQLANATARAPHYQNAFAADVVWGIAFSSLFIVAGVMAVQTGDVLDDNRQRNERLAGQAAAQRSREAERTFYNRLTHDKVLTLLRDARLSGTDPRVSAMAANLLRELDAPSSDATSTQPVGFDYLCNLVGAAIDESGAAVTRRIDAPPDKGRVRLPRRVAMALADAAAEAMRNAVRHGGDDPAITTTVSAGADRIEVTVTDDGPGFLPSAIGDTSQGIPLSIVGRMREIGGSGEIDSAPGEGTRVRLRWPK